MTLTKSKQGYYLMLDGTTSEVLSGLIAEGSPMAVGYFVDVATDKRYVLARRK
jgi:hypothetical protein